MTHGREQYPVETSRVIQVGGQNHPGVLELLQFELANELLRLSEASFRCCFTCPLAQCLLTSCWDFDFTSIHKGMPWATP